MAWGWVRAREVGAWALDSMGYQTLHCVTPEAPSPKSFGVLDP